MNIFVICSKFFYDKIPPIKESLEAAGHVCQMPNSYDAPFKEQEMKDLSTEEHSKWKGEMIRLHETNVAQNDAVLVLNFEKNGQENYIGGATFLEIGEAFRQRKKIFLYNPIPESIFTDELKGINPVILNGDLSLVR